MRKRITAFALALVSALLLMCPRAQTARAAQAQEDYIAAVHTKSNGKPYYIMVNRAQNTVTVYGLDDSGYYTVPVKAMVCSVGREGHATPAGTYSLGGRWAWLHMIDGSYGQYATQISGNILFHSVCYTKKDPSALMTFEYNALGERASLGCVRLQTADAKWIYDNCARGTKATIYDGTDPGALGKPGRTVDYITEAMDNGWDPTDPREENPWRSVSVPSDASAAPSSSSVVQPLPLPPAEERLSYTQAAQALYQISGETGLADPSDMVAWAVKHRLLDDIVVSGFAPSDNIARQDLITMLYRFETGYLQRDIHSSGSLNGFSDGQAVRTYAKDAMRWAVGSGLIHGTTATTLHPDALATKDQLDIILQRYQRFH